MKTILLSTFFLGLSYFGWAEQKTTTVKSKITNVTVYQQGAQIKRRASYSASKGINKIIIEGISPTIDPNSIQVNSTGNIILLDSKFKTVYPKVETQKGELPPKILSQIAALNDSLFEMSYDLLSLQNQIDVLKSEKTILANNGTIKGVGKVNDSIPLLKDALSYYHEKMNDINKALLKLNREKAIMTKKQTAMNTRLNNYYNYSSSHQIEINKKYEPIHQIEITVSANEATSGRVYVSYLVNNAGWIPQYDLRNNTAKNKINLTYKAQVYQNTGIEWENVKLSLSTNNPYANKTKPELHPWYLNYTTYTNQYRTSSITYNKKLKTNYASTPSQPATEDVAEEVAFADKDMMTSANFTKVIQQLVSVEYEIDLPYSISSNNEKYMVLVNSKTLDTEYKYYTVPKMDLSCFLVAQITDLDDLNLVPGHANIFHNGAYLGNTYLNTANMNDTMNLSLGKDPLLLVKRTMLKKESKEKIVGEKILKTFAYYIEVKNHKSTSVKITLQDQIPISQTKEIEIELINGSKGRLNEITGLMEWDLKLRPKEIEKIDLVYTVKYDKTKQVNLAH